MEDWIAKISDGLITNGVNLYSMSISDKDGQRDCFFEASPNCHNSYSVAKAFVVTAIGMLVDAGKLKTEDKAKKYIGDLLPIGYDPKWDRITIHNLLTHRIGNTKGFLDIDVEDVGTFGEDYLGYCLTRPLENEVGSSYCYSDGAFYILSRIVERASGEDLRAFLQKRLFNPMGFKEVAWSVCPQGHTIGATGLYINTSDMVKLGRLYLDYGVWNGRRLISRKWVETVLEQGYELRASTDNAEKMRSFEKGGMHGQMLYVSYEENIAIAWHAFDTNRVTRTIMNELGM